MIVDFTTTFVEEVVGLAEARGRLDRGRFHAEREALYRGTPSDRDAGFRDLYQRWFLVLGADQILRSKLAEFPRVTREVARCIVGLASRAKDEGVELLVAPERAGSSPRGRRLLQIQLLQKTVLDAERFARLMWSELLHIDDILDETFGYQPRLKAAFGGPTQDRLHLERYGALWSASVLSRVASRGGIEPAMARRLALARLSETFPMHAGTIEVVYADLLAGARPTHPELAALAADPGLRGGTHHGGRCSLCGFTNYSFERVDALSDPVVDRIRSDTPEWNRARPICVQCADLYRHKARSITCSSLS